MGPHTGQGLKAEREEGGGGRAERQPHSREVPAPGRERGQRGLAHPGPWLALRQVVCRGWARSKGGGELQHLSAGVRSAPRQTARPRWAPRQLSVQPAPCHRWACGPRGGRVARELPLLCPEMPLVPSGTPGWAQSLQSAFSTSPEQLLTHMAWATHPGKGSAGMTSGPRCPAGRCRPEDARLRLPG